MNITGFVRKEVRGLSAVMISSLLIFSSCKKDRHEEPKASGSRSELTADSLFLFAKEIYLWNTSLPGYDAFSPRSYVSSDMEEGLSRELVALTKYAVNPSTGRSFEYTDDPADAKYSYIFNTNDANPIASVNPAKSSVDLEGHGYDIGVQVGVYGEKTNYQVIAQVVYPNSPAAKAGMTRGDVITSINNKTVGTNWDTDYSTLYNAFYTSGSTVTLKGTKRTGGALNVTLTGAAYNSSPVYKDSVYQAGSKKIGYLAYGRFSKESDSKAALSTVFDKFTTAGVTDLILDLRYNGGGYVSTAQYLMNLIAPQAINGSVMFKEYYNQQMQSGKATILSKLPLRDDNDKIITEGGKIVTYANQNYSVSRNTYRFEKQGSLNTIANLVVIVTKGTASASELVINSLRPYINVKVVGEQTYGKPVGFFPVRIDKYDVYLTSFESKNSKDEGGYYSGLSPDLETADDPRYLFGDLREESFYMAHYYLKNGSFPVTVSSSSNVSATSATSGKLQLLKQAEKALPVREFKGMIEDRFHTK